MRNHARNVQCVISHADDIITTIATTLGGTVLAICVIFTTVNITVTKETYKK